MLVEIAIRDVAIEFEDYRYRTPIKFGGVALDRVTLANATVVVEDRLGKRATGFGSMPLGNVWAWPTPELTYAETLAAMKQFAMLTADVYRSCTLVGHPISIATALEGEVVSHGSGSNREWPMPELAKLVAASPFDAALHDAFGKLFELNCYQTYNDNFFDSDLSDFLGSDFSGETLERYILPDPKPSMPVYHLVGALDPLTPAEIGTPVGDGLPEHLGEWIVRDGLTHLKIKLNGDDLGWDLERTVGVDSVAEEVLRQRGRVPFYYSLDFNERCQSVEYLLEFLRRLRGRTPRGYDRVQYIEQPTARDLRSNPNNAMHEAAKLKPIVIDESLVDFESLLIAQEMGYTGVAFKACKGQTQTLLLSAAAQKYGMFRCVQDLTCPGASLIHSAGIAARIPGAAAIEANSRQYCPGANADWDARFPGVFSIRGGVMNTGILNGPGLGAV